MRRTRVKMCGMMRVEDARFAADLGADAVGFVFWAKSPRAVTPAGAAAIAAELPASIARVGVFVNASVDDVTAVVRLGGLSAVQLHGDEAIDGYMSLQVPLIKAVSLSTDADVDRVAQLPSRVTPLVDAADRERRGGTGRLVSWPLAARLAALRPIILAGGLHAENVREALRVVRPWGVDVSSGVEDAPGVKSEKRMREFFAAIAAADEETSERH